MKHILFAPSIITLLITACGNRDTRANIRAARLALGGVMLLATVLHFWALDQEGLNPYYAATVKSMLTS